MPSPLRIDERTHHDLVEDRTPVPLRVEGQTGQRDGSRERHRPSLGEALQAPRPTIAGVTVPTPHADALARIPVREGSVDVLGSTTRYWEYGPSDAAQTVVIAHGYRGDHHGLEPVIALLPEVRFIGPDLPGFGASTPMTEAPHSIDGLRAAGWGRSSTRSDLRGEAVLLGHSFGSMITTHAIGGGLRAPALILINPISTDPHKGGGARDERPDPRLLRRRPQAPAAPRSRPARQLGDRADHERHAREDPRSRSCAAGSTRSTTGTSTASATRRRSPRRSTPRSAPT